MRAIGLIQKLLLSILLVFTVMVAGLVAAVYWTFEDDLSSYLRRVEAEQVAPLADVLGERYALRKSWQFLRGMPGIWQDLVAQGLGVSVTPGEAFPREVLAMIPRLAVTDMQGRLMVRPPFGGPPGLMGEQLLFARDNTRAPAVGDDSQLETWPINANGQQVGWLKMVPTPVPTQGLNRQFREDRLRAFYLAAIPALLVALVIALPLGFHFLRPLQRLTQSLHLLAAGDYSVRLPSRRKDELGRLADDFNNLAQVLQSTETLRRESMANVSHELRTPISTMIAEVEAMIDGIRPLNKEQLQQLVGTMEHLNRLVDDLYQLALADVGKLVCDMGLVEWDLEIAEIIESMQAKLADKGLELKADLQARSIVLGDPHRLRQVVLNLLENCARYVDSPGVVRVSLRSKDKQVILRVADTGPGVNESALDRLFDRFSREEGSRSRGHGGAGLGLALVKAIVQAHGGSVSAANNSGGLEIKIILRVLESM